MSGSIVGNFGSDSSNRHNHDHLLYYFGHVVGMGKATGNSTGSSRNRHQYGHNFGGKESAHASRRDDGWSVYAIFHRYGVSVSDIQNANRDKSEPIRVGLVLIIPIKWEERVERSVGGRPFEWSSKKSAD